MFTLKKTFRFNKIILAAATALLTVAALTSCQKETTAPKEAAPYDGKDFVQQSQLTEAGEDPEKVIPYHVNLPEEYFIEVLYYALQVLPKSSPRYEAMERKWKEYAAR